MTEYAPDAIQKLFNDIRSGIPAALMGGILGDSAHSYGYHRGRNYVSSSDYSVQLAPDKKGDGEAASALDLSWSSAQPQYDVSKRLLNAKHDARLTKVLREFYGSTDGRTVCGWDYQSGYAVTSDDSHLWHVHLSILRQYATNYDALAPVADVIIGKGTSGDGGGSEDDVPDRTQVKRSMNSTKLGKEASHDLNWDEQSWDTGNLFYGADAPSKGETGARINTGKDKARSYVSTFNATVNGVPEGKAVRTALVWCDADTGANSGQSGWLETVSNGDSTPVVDTRVGYSNTGKAIKVRVQCSAADITVADAVWSVIYW